MHDVKNYEVLQDHQFFSLISDHLAKDTEMSRPLCNSNLGDDADYFDVQLLCIDEEPAKSPLLG